MEKLLIYRIDHIKLSSSDFWHPNRKQQATTYSSKSTQRPSSRPIGELENIMTGRLKLDSYPQLPFLLPPLLVYCFGSFLFELSVDPDYPFIKKLVEVAKTAGTPDLNQVLVELKARYTWLASAILNIVIPFIAIILSGNTIKAYLNGVKLAWTVIIGVMLCLGNLGFLLYSAKTETALYDLVFGFTYKMLVQSKLCSEIFLFHIHAIILTINILAAITPILLLLAVCATLALPAVPPNDGDPLDLVFRMRRLKEVVNVGSAFLVFGILHMNMWLNWSASLFGDAQLSSKVSGVAWSIATYWGVTFTLILTVTYVPASIYLQNQVRQRITAGGMVQAGKETEQWLNEQGFSFTLSNQLLQCISILAPFLAAPISNALRLS